MKIILTLIFALSFCNSFSQVMFGNVEHDKILKFSTGSYVTFSKPIEAMILGKTRKSKPTPLTIDGKKVYWRSQRDIKTKASFKNNDFSEYIFQSIKKDLELLPDGNYKLDRFNLVVDEKGKLAYFDFDTLRATTTNIHTFQGTAKAGDYVSAKSIQDLINDLGMRDAPVTTLTSVTLPEIPKETKLKIYLSLYNALKNCPKFKPARISNGKAVAYMLEAGAYNFPDVYVVKDHKASLLKIFQTEPTKPAPLR